MKIVQRCLSLVVVLVLPLGGCAMVRRIQESQPLYRSVKPSVAYEIVHDNPDDVLIVDLRTPEEFRGELGHLYRAVNLPLEELPLRLVELSSYRNRTFLVYCRADACGEEGMAILVTSGFRDAMLIAGGIEAWVEGRFGTVEEFEPEPAPPLVPPIPAP